MRDLLIAVLKLQKHWSPNNTPEMQRRGELIRNDIPRALHVFEPRLRDVFGPLGHDLSIEGRDGTGQKSQVPWVRFFSKSRSPSAQRGWYAVFLFHAAGDGAYLWLGHGSTRLEGGSYVARDDEEVSEQLNWARALLSHELAGEPRLRTNIELGSDKALPRAYEKSALAGFWYPSSSLPDDETLAADCVKMAELLSVLYNASDLGWQPQATPPDVEAAIDAIRIISTGGRPGGQGFGLSHAERQVVEKHAMGIVKQRLLSEGYSVEDVSATQPVDYIAKRGDARMFVEVKGTTGPPSSVLLTANEVALHERCHPNNALFVVHSIKLDRGSVPPQATAGEVLLFSPWSIDAEKLKAISYQYAL